MHTSEQADTESRGFLEAYPAGNAAITFTTSEPQVVASFHNLNASILSNRCPLFADAFEMGSSGRAWLELHADSELVAVCLMRYLYTGDYEYPDCPAFSLLLHIQMCVMADILDIEHLQRTCHWKVLRETEESCSGPFAPTGLCDGIRLLYAKLASDNVLKRTILSYCIHSFSQHHLAANEAFRDLVFEIPEFSKDLRRESCSQGFEHEGAQDIIRLPVAQDILSLPDEFDERADQQATLPGFLDALSDQEVVSAGEEPNQKQSSVFFSLPFRLWR